MHNAADNSRKNSVIPFDAEAGIFPKKWINTNAPDSLVINITRPSVVMLLAM